MNFSDIFKKSFLSGYAQNEITAENIFFCMFVTLVIAIYIYAFYRMMNKNAFYNKGFNISLVAIALITSAVILTLQSNIVISLGMVGALSIVRFRTAVKDPMDLVFLFWSISTGIICGAGMAIIAVISSVVISMIMIVLNYIPSASSNMILLVNSETNENEEAILEVVEGYCKRYQVRSRNLKTNRMDMVIEVSVTQEGELVKEVMAVEGVFAASLLSHNGEVTF